MASDPSLRSRVFGGAAILLLFAVGCAGWWQYKRGGAAASTELVGRPPVHVELGKVRPPLQYRIVSFHRGRADKRLIRLAADLGFNGVQFQIEGSTVRGISDFAKRDADEHLVDFCHSLGMQVTLWVHELSDVPPAWMPDWLGMMTVDNQAYWTLLSDRYDWVLHDAVPNVDGLCLTVVETQIRATNTPVLLKLVDLLRQKTSKYGKSLQVRTFVWYPDEYDSVMSAVDQLPKDTVIMSKCVPQDWQLRGMDAAEIGHVGGRPQIEEFDIEGEYFRRNAVANCMPALLKRQLDHAMENHISGICVRVDRDDDEVLNQPSEVNLWTLGMLAGGTTNNLDDVWKQWATNRFGAPNAAGIRRALEPTGDVVAEMLSIGPFAFGDTRQFPPNGDDDVFGQLLQNYWWDPKTYGAVHEAAESGDPAFTSAVAAGKAAAAQSAELSLQNLELLQGTLTPQDYAILHTKLVTNQAQLAFRAPMALAVLHYRRFVTTENEDERARMDTALQQDIATIRRIALPIYGPPTDLEYLGQTWHVGPPEDVDRDAIYQWAFNMDELRQGINPHPRHQGHGRWSPPG